MFSEQKECELTFNKYSPENILDKEYNEIIFNKLTEYFGILFEDKDNKNFNNRNYKGYYINIEYISINNSYECIFCYENVDEYSLYFNLNFYDKTIEFTKVIIDYLSEYENVKILLNSFIDSFIGKFGSYEYVWE